ncbi:MAG: hypothetical protein GYB65_00480 [Chloroflexi bacterium]|nr:hypothetical protein [Chloroflexota bacterium]
MTRKTTILRRASALVVWGVLVVLVLAACGGGDDDDSDSGDAAASNGEAATSAEDENAGDDEPEDTPSQASGVEGAGDTDASDSAAADAAASADDVEGAEADGDTTVSSAASTPQPPAGDDSDEPEPTPTLFPGQPEGDPPADLPPFDPAAPGIPDPPDAGESDDSEATVTTLPDLAEGEVAPAIDPMAAPGLTGGVVDLPPEELREQAIGQAEADLRSSFGPNVEIEPKPLDFLPPLPQFACRPLDNPPDDRYHLFMRMDRQVYAFQFYVSPEEGIGLVVDRCATPIDDIALPPSGTTPVQALIDQIKADLAAQGIDPEAGMFRVQTPNPIPLAGAQLGCRQPLVGSTPQLGAEEPAAANQVVNGYVILYDLDGDVYEYRVAETGDPLVLCPDLPGYLQADDLVLVLRQERPDILFTQAEEPVTYDGLDRDGMLLLFRNREVHVGVFGYDSPAEAAAAAAAITDRGVYWVYVAEYIVIVQEENEARIQEVLLSAGAEIVRNMGQERLDEELTDLPTPTPAP